MGFSILRGAMLENQESIQLQAAKDMTSDFPTLLHFSASHGLERFTSVLLECPGAAIANQMRNCADMTPPELAQVNGHFDLANSLQSLQVSTL